MLAFYSQTLVWLRYVEKNLSQKNGKKFYSLFQKHSL